MLVKVKRQLILMWQRGGFVFTLLLLIVLGIILNRPGLMQDEEEGIPAGEVQLPAPPGMMLSENVAKNAFGWLESEKTGIWRYFSSLAYELEVGKEIAAPGPGNVTSYGEKVIIDHGGGYKSEIWPLRAYFYAGDVTKGENLGVSFGEEINWKMTLFGEPVDPLSVQILSP